MCRRPVCRSIAADAVATGSSVKPSRRRVLLLPVFVVLASGLAYPQNAGTIRVSVLDPTGQPVAGVRLEARSGAEIVSTQKTDLHGQATFANIQSGRYRIDATKDRYHPLSKTDLDLPDPGEISLELTLIPAVAHQDSVEVTGTVNPLETAPTAPATLSADNAKSLPNRPATVADALPMLPGVVREPGGALIIAGAAEHRSAMIVNSSDVTDPATGQFGLTVPIDTVESVQVYETPFLAEYGRFTAGLVTVETRRGGEQWKWEINDPLPEFFIRSWHLRGLKDATPRLNFQGPIIAGKLYFSEGVDYEVRKIPVFTLPFPFNQKRQTGFNSFAQLDWVISDRHLVTATAHAAPQRLGFVNIDYFNPEPTSPDASTRNYTGTLGDRLSIFGGLLESNFSVTRFDAAVWPRGSEDLTITPSGNLGNYFAQQNRQATRIAGASSYTFAPIHSIGTHTIKLGVDLAENTEDGQVYKHPVDIRDAQSQLLERIAFTPGLPFDISDFGYAVFAQDHWMIGPRLAVDMGLRVESQEITESVRLAPRAGVSWTPFRSTGTILHAGFGWFYDRVPLNVYGFHFYPWEVVSFFGSDGQLSAGPFLYKNTLGSVFRHHRLVFQGPEPGNFSPQSNIYTLQVEQPVTRKLQLRVGYTQNDAAGLVTVTPEGPDLATNTGGYLLSGVGASRYRQFETTARYRLKGEGSQLFLSYVHSRARGDLNDFNNYLGSFPVPIVRGNQFGNLPGSVPNRFLAWGVVQLPAAIRISPVVEYRSGFPYAVTDVSQNYVGAPYSTRFPRFFSVDSRISKDIRVNPKYSVRLSLASFNLTNHFNPEAVHGNSADPVFGYFFGHRGRRFTADFDVLF
jgi:hypothetical protein